MESVGAKGVLIAVGGAEDKKGDCAILKEFVRLSKGAKAHVAVLTVATDQPAEAGDEYRQLFRKLGVKSVKAVGVATREDAQQEANLKALEKATGIFFTGDDQLHVTALLGSTELDYAIRRRFESGATLAGTSAGAAMMSNSMFINGGAETNPRFGCVALGPGVDFVKGVVIDTHFSQRGRIGRLITAVAHYPQDIGVGIDENTAVVFRGGKFEVIGDGAATIVDGGGMSYSNLPYTKEGESLALFDLQVHTLPLGYSFDLVNRKPLAPEEAAPKAPKKARAKAAGKK